MVSFLSTQLLFAIVVLAPAVAFHPAVAFLPTASKLSSVTSLTMSESSRYSNPNQVERFATAKKENIQRYLDITTVYDSSFLKGKRVAITGANRGIGLALAKEVTEAGAKLIAICRSSSEELEALKPSELVTGIDVRSDADCATIKDKISGGPIDIVSVQ
jgi:NADPH:quinone reductase-like Zn-dependent oxidoreductase